MRSAKACREDPEDELAEGGVLRPPGEQVRRHQDQARVQHCGAVSRQGPMGQKPGGRDDADLAWNHPELQAAPLRRAACDPNLAVKHERKAGTGNALLKQRGARSDLEGLGIPRQVARQLLCRQPAEARIPGAQFLDRMVGALHVARPGDPAAITQLPAAPGQRLDRAAGAEAPNICAWLANRWAICPHTKSQSWYTLESAMR